MFKPFVKLAGLGACLTAGVFAQTAPKVDFAHDVLPVFRQNCFGCHGPSQQTNGLRLDRRSSVFKDGLRRVVPGSSENSFLYHRLVGSDYGLQMPPTGPLHADQVELIKRWIDQGAEWPDSLANEADLPPLNPKAVALVETLRGDRQAFLKAVTQEPKLLNARGPEGSTPFMYAVLYGDAPMIEQLLKKGADPNLANDAKATALMWAATNLEKTRVLLAHGAQVNVLSDDMRSPLMIAAGRPGGESIVKLLLDHGANPNPNKNPSAESSPLIQAAVAGDADSMQMLMDHGAEVKEAGGVALDLAVQLNCPKCVDLLLKKDLDKMAYTLTMVDAANLGDANILRVMLDHGADVNAVDPSGRTALMYAAGSDIISADAVKLLIERGADVNARSQHSPSRDAGLTVLDIARFHGETPVVDALLKAGAKSAGRSDAAPQTQREGSIQNAIQHSLPLLQRGAATFAAKSGCISCHNNSIGEMTVGLARKNGFAVNEAMAAQQVKVNVGYLQHGRDALHQGFFAAQAGAEVGGDLFGPVVLSYVLVGLNAEHHQPDLDTDAVAMYLKSRQMADGHWAYPVGDPRPPLCDDYIGQTVLAMRALQLYAPKGDRAEYEKSIRLAASWIAHTQPITNEDRVWRLFGLAWASTDKDATQKAMRDVLGLQRPDGGWADFSSMPSSAYTTGKALVALQTAGLPVSDAAFQRGVQLLLNTEAEGGSWLVKTRALALQPYFDAGFPHGFDQSISDAGTGWATMALALASQSPAGKTTSAAGAGLK